MIQYALRCARGHDFDAWFKNAEAYEDQANRQLLACPACGDTQVEKGLMAPALARSGKAEQTPPELQRKRMVAMMKALRAKVEAEADYVGEQFAEEARRIHFGEAEERGIYGEASHDEVTGLIEDGIDIMPLPQLPEDQN